MIRFLATERDGGTLIGLGITAGNVERLRDGKPILVDVSELVVAERSGEYVRRPLHRAKIAIFYGETEDQIAADFKRAGIEIGEVRDERPNGGGEGEGSAARSDRVTHHERRGEP